MIRYVDDESLENEYISICENDVLYGTINSSLFRLYSKNNLGMFWNIYNEENNLCGNLSFVNETFTLSLKDESCIAEIAEFINFWGNYKFIKCQYCNAIKLYNFIEKDCKMSFGTVFSSKHNYNNHYNIDLLCKGVDTYTAYQILQKCFPKETERLSFESFNYEMNYRLRKDESFLFGLKIDSVVVSLVEVLAYSNINVIIGFLATPENYRNRGYASSLLKCVLSEFSDKEIFVFSKNEETSKFYKKIGFNNNTVWGQLEAV